jgi:hypothetical protein
MNTIIHKGYKLKIIKNTFLIYHAQDESSLTKAIYSKAATLLDTDKGFFISSHRSQGEQLSLVCAAHEGIDSDKYLHNKLLKSDIERLNQAMIRYFGAIEPAIPPQIRRKYAYEDISVYAPYIDYAFIESIDVNAEEDIAFLKELQRLSKELSIRIEVCVRCTETWREKISSFATLVSV